MSFNLQNCIVKSTFTGKSGSTTTLQEESEEDKIAKNAYIPYVYAKKCLTRVVGDLTFMKSNHIRIVAEMQEKYKDIEDETQVQVLNNVFYIQIYISIYDNQEHM